MRAPATLRYQGQLYVLAATPPTTGPEMEAAIRTALEPRYHDRFLVVKYTEGIAPSLWLHFANVPRSAPDLDRWNAKYHMKISVFGVPATQKPWTPIPPRLKVETSIGPRGLFRAKTGTPQQIVDYLIKFFTTNDALFQAKR
jgi:hypothetical protein